MYSGSPSHTLDLWGEANLNFVHCDIRGGKAKLCISKLILVFYQLASVGHKLLYGQNLKLKYYIYFNSTYIECQKYLQIEIFWGLNLTLAPTAILKFIFVKCLLNQQNDDLNKTRALMTKQFHNFERSRHSKKFPF